MRLIALFIATVFAFGPLSAQQQQITVKSFGPDENDNTALSTNKVLKNGDRAALIIVEPATDGGEYTFDMDATPIEVETRKLNGKTVYLVWVPGRSRYLNINYDAPNVDGTRYNFGRTRIEPAKSYRLKLGELYLTDQKQTLEFFVKPMSGDTYLEVGGDPWPLDRDGYAYKSMKFGEYEYRATAPGYHDEVGRIVVNNPTQAVKVNLTLRPAFGYLTIPATDELRGADIFVDSKRIGTGSVNKYRLDSKQGYVVKITKKDYNTYEATFDINDEQTTTLNPVLKGNFAPAHITAPKNAGIYVDGELKASGEWRGYLVEGNHVVEARLDGHTPSRKPVNVTDIRKAVELSMPAPTPIYGTLELTSTPRGAAIKIDGVSRGNTPLTISDLIVGSHKIEMTMQGYQPWSQTVVLKEGEPQAVNAKLTNIITVRIYAPQDNFIYVNGVRHQVNSGYYELRGKPGEYKISAPGGYYYKNYEKTVTFDANNRTHTIKHGKRLHQRNDYYFSAGIGGGSLWDAEFTTGFHVSGFNCEIFANVPFANGSTEMTAYHPIGGADGNTWYEAFSGGEVKAEAILGLRVGWRFVTGSPFDITPLIGYRHVLMKSTVAPSLYEDESMSSYCASGLAAVRVYWGISNNFGLSLTPEYYFAMAKGDAYSQFSEYSSRVKGWGTGFRVNLAAVLIF